MQDKQNKAQGWIAWFVGLPGSGKTTYALAVYNALMDRAEDIRFLSMDEQRGIYSPNPEYTDEERNRAYRLFAEEAVEIAAGGMNVIMDGTAHRLAMREYARGLVTKFAEVYVRCSLGVAMDRERDRPGGLVMADLYQKALERKRTGTHFEGLGQVVGVDILFEENPMAECVIESDRETIEQGRDRVLDLISKW